MEGFEAINFERLSSYFLIQIEPYSDLCQATQENRFLALARIHIKCRETKSEHLLRLEVRPGTYVFLVLEWTCVVLHVICLLPNLPHALLAFGYCSPCAISTYPLLAQCFARVLRSIPFSFALYLPVSSLACNFACLLFARALCLSWMTFPYAWYYLLQFTPCFLFDIRKVSQPPQLKWGTRQIVIFF